MKRPFLPALLSVPILWSLSAQAIAQGGGGGTGGGTIYFSVSSTMYKMNSDGTGKTPLPAGVSGQPSVLLHGGHRWFLTTFTIPGQNYPSAYTDNTRREMFAVRDDGNPAFTVQLTDQADLETNGVYRWIPGDAQVSWVARRWVAGQVVEGGIYSADILFDGAGNVVGLASQPAAPEVSLPLVFRPLNINVYFAGDLAPDIADILPFDWSPSGTKVVYDRWSVEQLWVVDLPAVTAGILIAPVWANTPRWSPDGTKVAFTGNLGGAFSGICTVLSNGTSPKLLIKGGTGYSVGGPRWSPTGSHLIYERFDSFNVGPPAFIEIDTYRATSGGKSLTNLTPDITPFAGPVEWR